MESQSSRKLDSDWSSQETNPAVNAIKAKQDDKLRANLYSRLNRAGRRRFANAVSPSTFVSPPCLSEGLARRTGTLRSLFFLSSVICGAARESGLRTQGGVKLGFAAGQEHNLQPALLVL